MTIASKILTIVNIDLINENDEQKITFMFHWYIHCYVDSIAISYSTSWSSICVKLFVSHVPISSFNYSLSNLFCLFPCPLFSFHHTIWSFLDFLNLFCDPHFSRSQSSLNYKVLVSAWLTIELTTSWVEVTLWCLFCLIEKYIVIMKLDSVVFNNLLALFME